MKNAQSIYPLRKALGIATVLTFASLGATLALAQGTTSASGTASGTSSGTSTSSGTLGREGNNMSGAEKLSRGDRHFVEKAAMGGEKEVKLARLASEHASDPRVRSYAETLIKDHEQANTELAGLASQKGITLATDEKDDRHYKQMSEKTGAEFDKDYVSYEVKDHEEDIEMYQKEARKGDDAQLAGFASKCLPVLQKHLQMAKDLQASLKR